MRDELFEPAYEALHIRSLFNRAAARVGQPSSYFFFLFFRCFPLLNSSPPFRILLLMTLEHTRLYVEELKEAGA